MPDIFSGKRILITGGTGSLGRTLVRRLLADEFGRPERVTVMSRDEAKQYEMRLRFRGLAAATEEVIYTDVEKRLHFRIGDVRDPAAVVSALRDADVVVNAAALKQVPSCEYFPEEAIATNVRGAENIVRAIEQFELPVETVVCVSTDKACKPVNVMGMTKALQERVFIAANLRRPATRFIVVRYGNVLASRGSVVPLFHSQIRAGGPVTITTPAMTRFMLSLDQAVDTIAAACVSARPGECWVPRVPASSITMLVRALIDGRAVPIVEVGVRPGEKVHEVLVSEEEAPRTSARDGHYVIRPLLPELTDATGAPSAPSALAGEYSSASDVLDLDATKALLRAHRLMLDDAPDFRTMFG